jgi:uncharacterized ubiquitin-like protein YukD
MKMQVIVKPLNKAAIAKSLELTVMPSSTVLEVQQRVASMTYTASFPEQKMLFNGKMLDVKKPLSDYGVAEGDVLEFSFEPSEKVLVEQLSALLGASAVSVEELGFLYIHRHGMPLGEVLEAIGRPSEKLLAFLEGQKCFTFDGGFVKVTETTEQIQEPSVAEVSRGLIEVRVKVEVHVGEKVSSISSDDEAEEATFRLDGAQSVAKAKEIIAATELIPFPNQELRLGAQSLEDDLSLHDAGITDGASLALLVRASEAALVSQLEEVLQDCVALSPNELSLHYCQRFGTPVFQALRILGLHGNIRRFLEGHPRFSLNGGCVALVDIPQAGAFLDVVIGLVSESCFLNIDSIERNIQMPCGATVFVRNLPTKACVLESLCKAVASGLEATIENGFRIERASVDGDLIHVHMKGAHACVQLAAARS